MKKIICALLVVLTIFLLFSCSTPNHEKITDEYFLKKVVEYRDLLSKTVDAVYDDWSVLGQTPESSKEYHTAKSNHQNSVDKLKRFSLTDIFNLYDKLKNKSENSELMHEVVYKFNNAYGYAFELSWEGIESFKNCTSEYIAKLDEAINELSAALNSGK